MPSSKEYMKEYHKQHRVKNRDMLIQQSREYYESNKEAINNNRRVKRMELNFKRLLQKEENKTLTDLDVEVLNWFKSLPEISQEHKYPKFNYNSLTIILN